MGVNVTAYPIKRKLNGWEYAYQTWKQRSLTIDYLLWFVRSGYYWTHLFANDKITKDTFLSSQYICVDIGISDCEFGHFSSNLSLEPTFAYTSPKDENGNEYYKLFYCFDRPIMKYEYPEIYNDFMGKLGILPVGKRHASNSMKMTHCGNSTVSYKDNYSGIIYKL